MLKTIHSNRLIDWEFLSDLSQMQNTSKWEILVKSNWKLVNKSINADYIETWENNKFISKSIYENLEKMEITENKGKKLGYAPLDENAKVPIQNLPFLDLESIFWRFRWNFSSKEKYIKNDRVFYEWSTYIALKDTIWNLPMDENFWWIFVEKWNDWNPGRDWNDWKDGKWTWDMLAVNNLSDLENKSEARKNLEVLTENEIQKKIENELIKENFAKKDWWNVFNWEQIFRGGLNTKIDNITNWLNFWLENNKNRIDSYNDSSWFQDLYFRAKNTIFENWNIWIWKNNPTEKLDIAWWIAFDNTFWLRYNNHNRLRLNQYDGWSWERRIYFEVFDQNWNNVWIPLEFDNFANWEWTRRIKLQFLIKIVNIPSSPNWLSSWDVYRDWDLLKIIP